MTARAGCRQPAGMRMQSGSGCAIWWDGRARPCLPRLLRLAASSLVLAASRLRRLAASGLAPAAPSLRPRRRRCLAALGLAPAASGLRPCRRRRLAAWGVVQAASRLRPGRRRRQVTAIPWCIVPGAARCHRPQRQAASCLGRPRHGLRGPSRQTASRCRPVGSWPCPKPQARPPPAASCWRRRARPSVSNLRLVSPRVRRPRASAAGKRGRRCLPRAASPSPLQAASRLRHRLRRRNRRRPFTARAARKKRCCAWRRPSATSTWATRRMSS